MLKSQKCWNCGAVLGKRQTRYCSRACTYAHRLKLGRHKGIRGSGRQKNRYGGNVFNPLDRIDDDLVGTGAGVQIDED